MIATAGSPIFFLNSCRDNRIHGVFDGRSDLHKALGEDTKEHGASSAPCFYVRIIFEQEKLSVFRLCRAEASCRLHTLGAEQIIHSGLFIGQISMVDSAPCE